MTGGGDSSRNLIACFEFSRRPLRPFLATSAEKLFTAERAENIRRGREGRNINQYRGVCGHRDGCPNLGRDVLKRALGMPLLLDKRLKM